MGLSDLEAARYLCVPVDKLDKLHIHKCPDGYSRERLAHFAAENGLPVGGPYNAIAVGKGGDERVIWVSSLEEALIKLDKYTRALVLPEPNENVWNVLKHSGTRMIIVQHESDFCHLSVPDWDEAILALEMYFAEAVGD